MVRRRLIEAPEDQTPPEPGESSPLGEFLSDAGASQRIPGATRAKALSDLQLGVRDAETRARTGDWDGARGPTFVGMYAMCHRLVYRVLPEELEERPNFRAASRAALTMLHVQFGDDSDAMAEYMRWLWEREKGRVRWAAEKGIERNRIGWRLAFSTASATDYRAAMATRGRRG